MNVLVSVETTHAGGYSHMQLVEDGRPLMQAHCGDPKLDWRLLSVVIRALAAQGRTICMAEDFDAALHRLGYRREDGEVVKD